MNYYGPWICIGAVLAVLFVIWAFCGGRQYEFVGLKPLDPNNAYPITPSQPIYNWGHPNPAEAALQPDPEPQPWVDLTPVPTPEPEICRNNAIVPPAVQPIPIPAVPLPRVPPPPPAVARLPPIKKKGRVISRGERRCCQTMERIYGVPFISVWPDWLRNPETGAKLELDCYNEELQIAVEYNGPQHYKWPNFTNQTHTEFINQVRRDELKARLCDQHGVYLITVPYDVPYEDIPAFITSHLPETLQVRLKDERTLADL